MGGGNLLREDGIKEKELNKLQIDNIIDETINLSIILRLKELKIITESQFYKLREKIKAFY